MHKNEADPETVSLACLSLHKEVPAAFEGATVGRNAIFDL